MVKVGIIGCGAIGTALAKAIHKKFKREAQVCFLSDISDRQIKQLQKKLALKRARIVSIQELVRKSDFIIETASQEVAAEVIPIVLRQNKQILVLSVGGLLKILNLKKLLQKNHGKVYVPSGGIAGVDALLASCTAQVKSVQITSRKPLKALLEAPYFINRRDAAKKITRPTLIFEGTAQEAIDYFPQNINVAATLSLAGIGSAKTKVRIFTSPTYRFNQHEIEVEGDFGKVHTSVTNVPSHVNPKTSALAIGSAVATLGKIFSPLKVGT